MCSWNKTCLYVGNLLYYVIKNLKGKRMKVVNDFNFKFMDIKCDWLSRF